MDSTLRATIGVVVTALAIVACERVPDSGTTVKAPSAARGADVPASTRAPPTVDEVTRMIGMLDVEQSLGVQAGYAAILNPGHRDSTAFGVSRLTLSDGVVLLLERMERRVGGGQPQARLLAVLRMPEEPAGFRLVLGRCRVDKTIVPGLLAVVRDGRGGEDWTGSATAAWIASGADASFVPYPTERVECENIGGGV